MENWGWEFFGRKRKEWFVPSIVVRISIKIYIVD